MINVAYIQRTCIISTGSDITSKESLINTTKLSVQQLESWLQDSSSESLQKSAFPCLTSKSDPGSSDRDEDELADSIVNFNGPVATPKVSLTSLVLCLQCRMHDPQTHMIQETISILLFILLKILKIFNLFDFYAFNL